MDVMGIYKRAFEAFKTNYVISVPFIVVNVILALISIAVVGTAFAGQGVGAPMSFNMGAMMGGFFVLALLGTILNVLAQGLAIGMSLGALEKGFSSLNEGWHAISDKVGSLILASILVGVVVGIGFFLLFIPGLVAFFFLMFTVVALVVENLEATTAMGRSYSVVRQNSGDALIYLLLTLGIMIGAMIVGGILAPIPLLGPLLSTVIQGVSYGIITLAGVAFFREATGKGQLPGEL